MNRTRRRFIITTALAGTSAALIAAAFKGVRFPPLQFEPEPLPRALTLGNGRRISAVGAYLQSGSGGSSRWRAFAPEPELSVPAAAAPIRLRLDNVHPGAVLTSSGGMDQIDEQVAGLSRQLVLKTNGPATLRWRFPGQERFRFTAIGDTGGGTELKWALQRSVELGADFVLHLGDINYAEGDFPRAVEHLTAAAIPVFTVIGNHDFFEDWSGGHDFFVRNFGPRNYAYQLGGVQFINIDTAAGTFPRSAGERKRLLDELANQPGRGISERVVFTHKPLADPPEKAQWKGDEHAVGGLGEADWIRARLLQLGARTLLAGHIHVKSEYDDQGLQTYVTGQGLGHADLIVGRPYAEILVGDVAQGRVRFHWQPLNMPFSAHCSPRAWEVLEVINKPDVLEKLKAICAKTAG